MAAGLSFVVKATLSVYLRSYSALNRIIYSRCSLSRQVKLLKNKFELKSHLLRESKEHRGAHIYPPPCSVA